MFNPESHSAENPEQPGFGVDDARGKAEKMKAQTDNAVGGVKQAVENLTGVEKLARQQFNNFAPTELAAQVRKEIVSFILNNAPRNERLALQQRFTNATLEKILIYLHNRNNNFAENAPVNILDIGTTLGDVLNNIGPAGQALRQQIEKTYKMNGGR